MTMSDELARQTHDSLEAALALLAAGVSLDDILTDAGEDATWLRPLLDMALEVSELPPPAPLPAPEASLARLLAHGEALTAQSSTLSPAPVRPSLWWTDLFRLGRRPLWATALLLGLLLCLSFTFLVGGFIGGGLVAAAQDSLPGQSLYALKRVGENVRLRLVDDPAQREDLLETFQQRRCGEVALLLERNEQAQVAFASRVEAMTASDIDLGCLSAQITSDTDVQGELTVGARVQVEGWVRPGVGLVVTTITVLEPAPAPVGPTPTATISPTPTLLPATPTATQVKSSATDTLNISPTPTAPPAPTLIPTSTPTAIPPTPPVEPTSGPGEDGGGDDDDNSNENDNDIQNENEGPEDEQDNENDNGNDNDNSGGDDHDDQDDNSGRGDNSGSSGNSGSDSDNSGSGSDNSGSGSSNSGSGSKNSGSDKDDDND
jgi:uncharacterized membrane protein YgcG